MGDANGIEGDGNARRRGLLGDSGDEFEEGIPYLDIWGVSIQCSE